MKSVLLGICVLAVLAGQASAGIYYLYDHQADGTPILDAQGKPSPGTSVTINGAVFNNDFSQPTGTGVFQPFLRLQNNGGEEGYNSDAATNDLPFDEKPGIWTHSLQLGNLQVVNGNFEFRLDLNETASDPLIGLDALKLYVNTPASTATGTASPMPTNLANGGPLGDLVYDLGANTVVLDYRLNNGSGSGDLSVLIPQTLFTGHSDSEYLTLYSKFGDTTYPTDAGFEEWNVQVPLPGAVLLGLLGLGAAGLKLRKAV